MLHFELTERIVGCLITVHRALSPGLAERSYHMAAALELKACGIPFVREPAYEVRYRGVVIGLHKPDLIIKGKVVLELKCVANLDPIVHISSADVSARQQSKSCAPRQFQCRCIGQRGAAKRPVK